MKVFSMNDCDWMAGENLESCKDEYVRMYWGGSDEEAFDDPREVSEADMNRLKFRGEEGEPDEGVRTFKEELERLVASGAEFPRFFASTEY